MNDRRVNGIHRIDSWFEGLVEVDEELRTVHFIHGSIQQFLLNPPSEPGLASFHFDAEEVDHHLGEICITFLNFNDLDRTIAKRPKPMPSPVTPNIMLQHAINFEPHLKQLRSIRRTDLISKFKSAPTLVDTDSNLANSTFRSSPASGVFEALGSEHPFIRYAAIHWLSHATGFEKNRSKTWSLWESMVMRGHQLAYSPTTDRIHICLDDDLVAWSLEVRHTGLLHLILASNQHGIHGMEVLGWAVQEEDEEMVRLFLQHNRGIAVTSQHLFASVKHGRHEMVRLLIEYSVDLDLNYPQPWFDSCTPLQHCATVGDYMMLRILIEAGATLDTHEPNQNTPLGLATHHGHYECMRLLLSSGAKVNYSTPLGAPLKFAIKRSDIEAVKILLEAGAQVNAKPTGLIKRSFLLIAVEQVSFSDFAIRKAGLDVIRMLLECGADANGHPLDDPTPLQAAVIRENVEVASLLIANGADLNCPGAGRSSPLQLAMTTGAFDLIGFLLREGADPNRPVSEGRPPLEIASMLGNFKLVRLLISFNANPNGSSLDGLTFLQRASFQGDLGIVNVLLEAGAIVDATNGTYSRKPLMLASAGGYVDIQKVLLGRGASVDSTSPGEEGVTALQCAVDSGSFQAVKVLLEAGAEVKSSLMYKSMMSRSDCNEIPDLLRSYAAIQKTRSDGTGHSRKPSNGDTETET